MPKIIVTQAFKFAHRGYDVEEFSPGSAEIETSEECALLAIHEGWAIDPSKAARAAPENRDAAARRSNKARTSELASQENTQS